MYAETRPTSLSSTDTRIPQILASPAAMQIRQLEALQNMARTAGAKVVFGEAYHPQYPCPCHTALTPPRSVISMNVPITSPHFLSPLHHEEYR